MLKNVLIGSYNPKSDGLNGSFYNIKNKLSNLKSSFIIEHNSVGSDNGLYVNVLSFDKSYMQFWNDPYPFLRISLVHHRIQITHFVIGMPTSSCYSSEFELVGIDEENNEITLGNYLSLDYNFCGDTLYCKGTGPVTFDVKENTTQLLKGIKFLSKRCICQSNHFTVKGVEIYGNLYQRINLHSIRCKRHFSYSTYATVLFISLSP